MEVKDELFEKALGENATKADLIQAMEAGSDSLYKQLKYMVDGVFLGKAGSSLCWSDAQKDELQKIEDDFARARMAILRAKGHIVELKANVSESARNQFAEDWENGIN
ncbi:MAG: hypothetical protein IJY90_02560 [Clostridia bacterium]|nr:hypothetical protein [Clostridia bacterium]